MKFVIVLVAVLAMAVAKPQCKLHKEFPSDVETENLILIFSCIDLGAPISNTAGQNSNAVANGPGSTAISKGTANANMQAPVAPLYPPGPYPGPYPPLPIYPGPVSNNAQQGSNAAANGPGSTAISDGTANANLG